MKLKQAIKGYGHVQKAITTLDRNAGIINKQTKEIQRQEQKKLKKVRKKIKKAAKPEKEKGKKAKKEKKKEQDKIPAWYKNALLRRRARG